MRTPRMGAAAVTIVLAAVAFLSLGAADAAKRAGESVYGLMLQSEVDSSEGRPRAGGDPASQPQTNLAAAARTRAGAATWGAEPARAVEGGHTRHGAAEVLGHPERTGVLSGGCVLGYGVPGEQCVPARAPGNREVTCSYLARQFPDGLPVTGKDVLGLDANHDGRACAGGDAGAQGSAPQPQASAAKTKAKRKAKAKRRAKRQAEGSR